MNKRRGGGSIKLMNDNAWSRPHTARFFAKIFHPSRFANNGMNKAKRYEQTYPNMIKSSTHTLQEKGRLDICRATLCPLPD